mgnify:CR=1 FL=1|tara:strand:- start:41591 stop:42286 length:696 start_codon:yes stop_codon:yes gene_type:complete
MDMKELLLKFGIDCAEDAVYEYASNALDWWDSENRTSIEIELHQIEDGLKSISIIFCPDVERIVERKKVFSSSFNGKGIKKNALVAKAVFENINCKFGLPFSDEQNAYITTKASESELVLDCILNLIGQKVPTFKIDLNESNREESSFEVGDTLEHFIAMMDMNSTDFTKENIIASLKVVINFEGDEYLDELKNDITSGKEFDYEVEYGVNKEKLNLIKETIINYTQSLRS